MYSRIESAVTCSVTVPVRSAVSVRVVGSRIAVLPAVLARYTAAAPDPIASPADPDQCTDIG